MYKFIYVVGLHGKIDPIIVPVPNELQESLDEGNVISIFARRIVELS